MKYNNYSKYDYDHQSCAKGLRSTMTPEERKLWYEFLKNADFHVYRQRPIDGYIVDFYIPSACLVIEIDGSQHYSEEGKEYDQLRTDVLNKNHLTVMRFTNTEIKEQFSGVCERINQWVHENKIY